MTPDELREAVARLYIDKWGLSDYWLADAAIALVVEEVARVAEGDEASATEYYRGRVHAAAAIRAYSRKDEG